MKSSSRTSKKVLQDKLIREGISSKGTKRGKESATTSVAKRDRKGGEAIANNQRRTLRRHTQRKTRVQPLTKSSGGGRGNAQTRRRKGSRG